MTAFTNRVASDGEAAVLRCIDGEIDVVLMDLQMPKLDGFDATRRIKANPQTSELPIVALTANVMKSDRDKCLAAGMTGFISKPFKPKDLLEELQRAIQASAQ